MALRRCVAMVSKTGIACLSLRLGGRLDVVNEIEVLSQVLV
jgi:hypothetical protein